MFLEFVLVKRLAYVCLSLAALVAGSAATDAATIAAWNFNAGTSPGTASTGVGISSGFAFPFSSALPLQDGSPNDTNPVVVNGGPNNASAVRSGPNPLEAPGGRVARFNTSTVGFLAPTVTLDLMQGFRSSRFYQMQATSDGVNFGALPTGGTGSSVSNAFGSASISDTGLITIQTVDGLIDTAQGQGYLHDLSYSFPAGTAFDNNPSFGVRIFATFDPNGADYVSSFAGTTSADTTAGYIRNTAAGGNQIRYDLVRISGVMIPEPTTATLCFVLLGATGLGRRRKNSWQ